MTFDPETMDETLVMAMPRRELYALNGFDTAIALPILSSLESEYWLATSAVIANDIEAKEVQVGVVFLRGSQVLVSENGIILHTTSVPAEILESGAVLRSLRDLARIGAENMLATAATGSVLSGYVNDDSLVDMRPYFVLVYDVFFPEDADAPEGMSWIECQHLNGIPIEPASLHLLPYTRKTPRKAV